MTHDAATTADIDLVYALYMDEQANPWLTFDPMDKTTFQTIFAGLIETRTVFVVREGDQFVGTYRLIPKTDRQEHILYLGSFTVGAASQGKGLAKKILAAIRDKAVQAGKKRIELTVGIKNAAAIALYKKSGFQIEGVVRQNYRLASTGKYYDEYLMGLLI